MHYTILHNTSRDYFLRESPKTRAVHLPDKLNEQANRKSWFAESAIRCTSTTFLTSIKQRTRRKTVLPRDLLYMQIRDGYGGNRGMWWRLTETRYRQVSSVKCTLRPCPPPSSLPSLRVSGRRFISWRTPYVARVQDLRLLPISYVDFNCIYFYFYTSISRQSSQMSIILSNDAR